MAFTATATKVFTRTGLTPDSATFGVISQANGSFVAASSQPATSFPFPTDALWYKTLNNGLNWNQIAQTEGGFSVSSLWPANVHENIIVGITEQPATGGVSIIRSADSGSTWNTVFSAAPAASPNGRFVYIQGLQSYERTKVIAWGALDGDETNPAAIYGLSADAGATWTPVDTFDPGDFDDGGFSFGLAEGGFWWMGYIKFGGINRQSWLARSENYGASWTPLHRTRNTNGTGFVAGSAICAFDQQNILVCSTNGVNPTDSVPGVWWSDDAGDTLNHVPGSDIVNWPSGAFYTNILEAKRLTRDACILSIDQQNGTPGSPWRISFDRGHTFPLQVNLSTGSFPPYVIPGGKICTARDGALLAMTWESSDYSSVDHCIYRIVLDC